MTTNDIKVSTPSRRTFFKGMAGIAIAGVALAGGISLTSCAGSAGTVKVSAIETDLLYLENGFTYILTTPAVAALIPAATLTKIDAVEADLKTVLSSLATAGDTISLSTAQGYVSLVAGDIKTALDAVIALQGNGVTLPSKVITILEAVEALLPVIEEAVNIAITAFSVSKARLTPKQARIILAQA